MTKAKHHRRIASPSFFFFSPSHSLTAAPPPLPIQISAPRLISALVPLPLYNATAHHCHQLLGPRLHPQPVSVAGHEPPPSSPVTTVQSPPCLRRSPISVAAAIIYMITQLFRFKETIESSLLPILYHL
ncbi:uncharacterized protein LOC116033239 [Ipomoea triloba]|uniref:uncharacterized protein LOC116033239 n=1 Tax=Ipomoea triloba TaxID=35885 RepID=UPI00125D9580|nr:uncharacterized protein LOC116033239 [Ipomoea triloba]